MNEPSPAALATLTARERETLQLLLRGHDAKSIAQAQGLSVHTVNERLRDARRKLGVGSSREAARLVGAAQPTPPEICPRNCGNTILGVPAAPCPMADPLVAAAPMGSGGRNRPYWGMMMIVIVLATATGALLMHAQTQPAPAAQTLSPLARPHVVATSPADGATIKAGSIVIRVTFDRAMRDGSYSFITSDRGAYPACPGRPVRSRDGRSFTLRCTTVPGRGYAIGFNGGRFMNFVAQDTAVPAEPAHLAFSTRPD